MSCKDCVAPPPRERSAECDILIAKTIASGALMFLLYIAVTCPCRPALYSCHLSSVYAALFTVLLVIVYYNGARVRTWKS